MRRVVMSFGGGGAPAAPILDSLTAVAAYSPRKLRTAYAGSAIRVRRSSDNTEADIGFSGNDLDTAALLSFCGAGSGFLVTRYDQVGTNNQTQATTTLQPRIVNAGVLETLNGKAAPNWTGSTMRMTHTPFNARHLAAVGNLSASAGTLSTLAGSVSAAPTGQLRRAITQTDGWRAAPTSSDYPGPTATWIDGGLPTAIDQGGGIFALVDPLGSPRVWQFQFNVLRNFDIVGNDATSSRAFIGHLPEMIYFSTTLTTEQRQQLEADQGAYWGITVNF
ncbi:MAG: arabinofuranosidase catalytic domain-containing protein [Plesiomonas shigelloides]